MRRTILYFSCKISFSSNSFKLFEPPNFRLILKVVRPILTIRSFSLFICSSSNPFTKFLQCHHLKHWLKIIQLAFNFLRNRFFSFVVLHNPQNQWKHTVLFSLLDACLVVGDVFFALVSHSVEAFGRHIDFEKITILVYPQD